MRLQWNYSCFRFLLPHLLLAILVIACGREDTSVRVIAEPNEAIHSSTVMDTLPLVAGSFFNDIFVDSITMTPDLKEVQFCLPPTHKRRILFTHWDVNEADEFSILNDSSAFFKEDHSESGWGNVPKKSAGTTPTYMFSEWYLEEQATCNFFQWQGDN